MSYCSFGGRSQASLQVGLVFDMTDDNRIGRIEQRIYELDMTDGHRIERLEQRIYELEQDRKSFFKTGIITLGGFVLILLGYIFKTQVSQVIGGG